jgi:hypothetical protein
MARETLFLAGFSAILGRVIKELVWVLTGKYQEFTTTCGYAMISRRPPHKPDPLVVLLLVVALGLSVTVAYQVNVYYNNSQLAIARSVQIATPGVGG